MYFNFWIRPPVVENWVSKIGEITGTVAIELRQIPNQPITFAVKTQIFIKYQNWFSIFLNEKADPEHKSRLEDDIIAWTWNTFIESNGSDPNILLYMAMTKVKLDQLYIDSSSLFEKAVVRAMDATEQFLSEKKIEVPEKFIVAGGSKVNQFNDYKNDIY
jgi:PhoPQ-activated pathogenicity-related protein